MEERLCWTLPCWSLPVGVGMTLWWALGRLARQDLDTTEALARLQRQPKVYAPF